MRTFHSHPAHLPTAGYSLPTTRSAATPIPGAGGAIGISATFNGKTSCSVVLNDTTGVDIDPPAYPIFLGPGTKDCLVVTHEAGTVQDSGTNNRIITVPRR